MTEDEYQRMKIEIMRELQQEEQPPGTVPPGAMKVAQQFMGGGGGGGAAGGGAMSYAAPAAAMAGLIYGGKKLGIGAESQLKEYKRFGKRAGKELGRAADKLKFWEWF